MSTRSWRVVVSLLLAVPVTVLAEGPTLKVYGILDVGVVSQNRSTSGGTADAGAKTGFGNGLVVPTLIGVNGSHELTNGNKLEFQLEGGVNLDSGGPGFGQNFMFGRNANFGVSGSWGSIRGGFELTPFLGDIGAVDLQGLSQAGSALNFYLDALGIKGLFDNRMIQYRSPDFSGFKFSAGLGTGNVPGNASRGQELQATASYTKAGFNAGAGYLSINQPATTGKAAESFWAGAGYKFAPVTVKAMFQDAKTASGTRHTQYFGGGLGWDITSSINVKYAYYDYQDKDVSASKAQAHTLAASYAWDTATNVYLGYTTIKNAGTMQVEPLAGSSFGGTGAPTNASTGALYAGLYYIF